MTIPTIDALPAVPSRNDQPDAFVANTDAFLGALPTLRSQINAASVAIDAVGSSATTSAATATTKAGEAAGSATTASAAAALATSALTYVATSSTSLSIGTGSKAFTLNEAGRSFAVGDAVVAERRSDPATRMVGTVSSYAGNVLTLNATSVAGSGGPYTDWLVFAAAFNALPGAAAADVRAGSSSLKALTPGDTYNAFAEVPLTDAATIAVDMSTFINAKVTLGGNRALGNPTNPKVGQTGFIRLIQDATGSRTLSFGSNWKRQGGAPGLTSAANAIDVLEYQVITPTYILYNVLTNPS